MILKGSSKNADGVYFGNQSTNKVRLGTKLIWEKAGPLNIEHYGLKWTINEPREIYRCNYLYDCDGWSRVLNNEDGTFNYGNWTEENVFFLRNLYPVMCKSDGTEDYKLSKIDHRYKEDGITSSDVDNPAYDGNAMVCFNCHIWVKFFDDGINQGFEISNYKLDNDFVDWPYIRPDGSRADKLYFPMFSGTIVNGKLRSIGTGKAQGDDLTTAEELAAARANDGLGSSSVWTIGDWSHRLWFNLLSTLIGKDTSPKSRLGLGNCYNNDFINNGLYLDKGAFYGITSASLAGISPVKTFYCENMWGNRQERLLGYYNVNGTYYVKQSPPYTTDGTYSSYINCGSLDEDSIANGGLCCTQLSACGFVPKTVRTTSGTIYPGTHYYFGAGYFSNNEITSTLVVGGRYNSREYAGPWSLDFTNLPENHDQTIGASLYLIQPK